ncbi:MAG: L,D-transpeptidase family protein [Gemmatimonas sp.]|nr:L,D-transpeptidase family protein [Gemmatimonas sp.]
MRKARLGTRRVVEGLTRPIVLLSGLSAGCVSFGPFGGESPENDPSGQLERLPVPAETFVDTASGAFVLVDLDDNILRFMDREEVVWEAPVGTGTGLHLESEEGDWLFTTPRGVFQVKYKEELPVWFLPDWYFIENELPMPPENSPDRRQKGQLGVAAVYLGEEIAIHGTNRPELLGQRVSHGCIRLENKFAQRLYHNVQIGTPIVIVGGEDIEPVELVETDPGPPPPTPPDPLGGVPTSELLRRLANHLDEDDTTGAWVPLTSRLITRGLQEDAPALRGILALAGTAGSAKLNREYGTFLADAFSRGSWRAVVSLARIDEEARDRATQAIVQATMSLYPGSIVDEYAPWPTRRIPSGILGPDGMAGWESLLTAEGEYRESVLVLTGSDREG